MGKEASPETLRRMADSNEKKGNQHWAQAKSGDGGHHYAKARENYDRADRMRNLANERDSKNDSGCFITTAVCETLQKTDDCYELTIFRNFRDKWLLNQPDGKLIIESYYHVAPKIVASINQLPNSKAAYLSIWDKYLQECLNHLEKSDFSSCKNVYMDMVNTLESEYLTSS